MGSFIGTVTLFLLFVPMTNICVLVFKFMISILMICVTFGYKNIRYISKNICYFYLVSMLLGGGISFLQNQFSYTNHGLVFTNHGLGFSYGVVLLLGLFLFLKYMRSFKELKNHYSQYYTCKIYFDEENCLEVQAFLDTGNQLKDPYSNKSIVLLHEDKIDKSKKYTKLYVPYHSLNHQGLLTCCKALKLEIDGKCCEQFLVGLSTENFFIDGIDCIINNRVMEGLK